eukprot:461573-Hanusia_phi.AAC.1
MSRGGTPLANFHVSSVMLEARQAPNHRIHDEMLPASQVVYQSVELGTQTQVMTCCTEPVCDGVRVNPCVPFICLLNANHHRDHRALARSVGAAAGTSGNRRQGKNIVSIVNSCHTI